MTYPGFRQAEMMGYFMDQGLLNLLQDINFSAADGKDGLSKYYNAVREALALEKTFSRNGDALIQSEKKALLGQTQFLQ